MSNSTQPMSANRSYASQLGILFILLVLFLSSLLGTTPFLHFFGLTTVNLTLLIFSRVLYWFFVLLLWWYATNVEQTSFLLNKTNQLTTFDFGVHVVLLMVVLYLIIPFFGFAMFKMGMVHKSKKIEELWVLTKGRWWLIVLISITAGFVEEMIFRGYIQPRLQQLTKSPVVAILVTSLLFGALHYRYGTLINVVGPFVIGIILGIYYFRYKQIAVVITCHFLWDFISLSVSNLLHK